MMIHLLRSYYRKFGGLKAIRFFIKCGLLWPMTKIVMKNPFSRHSYMNAYYVAVRNVEYLLKEKFAPLMNTRKVFYSSQSMAHVKSKFVWFCWLQGIEKSPQEIKACYISLVRHLKDRKIIVIDDKNWNEYISLPDYIVTRWEKNQISPAHFTDLIRLQLLINYGGTWIDSTVLCTGIMSQNKAETNSFFNADLFMFQYTKPGSKQWGGIGNWFITASTNNTVLLVLRDMLFAYWQEFDFIADYYIFHLFFSMLREVFPEEIKSMPYGYCVPSITLVYHWAEKYNHEKWEKFTSKVCFHKLTYIVKQSVLDDKENYYHFILSKYQ